MWQASGQMIPRGPRSRILGERGPLALIKNRGADMARTALYTRVSSSLQDGEDKVSLSEQIADCETYARERGLDVVARYSEVGRGTTKHRPQFQAMLADARAGRFDTIVAWKSDRLGRGMYPASALMEVVEASGVTLEAVKGFH